MPQFVVNAPVETTVPNVEVTVDPAKPLAPGKYTFQLVVGDDSKNLSKPATVEVIVRDSVLPTAVIAAPAQVEYGQSFSLVGKGSSDVPPGKVVRYVWMLVPRVEPVLQPIDPRPIDPRPAPTPE